MCIISFQKIPNKHNILFDEFFIEYDKIDIIAFNYNGQGAALCECDGTLTSLDAHRLEKILFGVHRLSLENYLQSIFDPDYHSDEVHKTGQELIFRSPELTALKKYDIANLAKKTLKEVQETEEDTFVYFTELQKSCTTTPESTEECCTDQLFGNTKSMALHKHSCKSYNKTTCTAVFSDKEEAIAAGYKPCGQCKP